jgi:hypothetical protein
MFIERRASRIRSSVGAKHSKSHVHLCFDRSERIQNIESVSIHISSLRDEVDPKSS